MQVKPINPEQQPLNYQQVTATAIQIPDRFKFEHFYEFAKPCCGDHSITSEFDVPGIGKFQHQVIIPCCKCRIPCAGCCAQLSCLDCNRHLYPDLIYELRSNDVRIKLFLGNYGKVYIGNALIGDVVQAMPNQWDVAYGRCCSGYPQFHIEEPGNPLTYVVTPDRASCPTCQFNIMCCACSPFGYCKSERNVTVTDTNGNVLQIDIRNTRGFKSKCSNHCLPCWCDAPNYPEYEIDFSKSTPPVSQRLRILIVASLVMQSFFDKWALIGFPHLGVSTHHSQYRVSSL
ncbi:hypothetical protein pb186bvf_015331 [Paramecium bursaria]